jgi:hypothetical protein
MDLEVPRAVARDGEPHARASARHVEFVAVEAL